MLDFLVTILPLVALSAWYLGRSGKKASSNSKVFSREYLVGLNFLLNEQPDKAVDIFIKMLEVDSETVETHLALGNLFRRKGEVDRAIRIHQNLIARPNLDKSYRTQALLSLGRDYMIAGMFDRAERLFYEVMETGNFIEESLKYVLAIYEQQKDWDKAITIAQKLEAHNNIPMHRIIAHYYCELALEAKIKSLHEAQRLLKKAFIIDNKCVRASLIQGKWEFEVDNYKAAIRAYKHVVEQDPDYISEAIPFLVICYEKLGNEAELIQFLRRCLEEYPRISIILALCERLQYWHSEKEAADFLALQLNERASIHGLSRLIELQIKLAEDSAKDKLQLLHTLTIQLLKDKPIYRCGHCGFAGKVLHWQCPSCKLWNSVKPIHGLEGD